MSIKRTLLNTAVGFGLAAGIGAAASAEEITIATVNNNDMIVMQKLAPKWEEATGNTINWVVLEENVLRQRTTQDIATNGGSFDIIFIGAYETPIWGAQRLADARSTISATMPPTISKTSSRSFATAFRRTATSTPCRSIPRPRSPSIAPTCSKQAGIEVPTEQITYTEFAEMAAKLHDPDNGIYGTCQRGKAGWGENMAFVGPMVNAFGGQWFDMDWNPTIDSPEWNAAITYYVDLMTKSGPPGATGERPQREPCAVQGWQMRHLGRRDLGRQRRQEPGELQGRRRHRLLPGAEAGYGQRNRLVLVLGARHPGQLAESRRRQGFPEVGRPRRSTSRWSAKPRAGSPCRAARALRSHDDPRYLEAAPFAATIKEAIFAADPTNPTHEPGARTPASSSSRSPSSRASATTSVSRSRRPSPVR